MKTGLCNFCLKSGILCSKCQAKLKSGKVSKVDLTIARLLLPLENKYPSLQKINLYKAVEADGTLALIVGRGDVARLLANGGKVVRMLEEKIGKKIRVLEKSTDTRKFLEDLFATLAILTINTIWLPDGTTETKVILNRGRRRSPFINVKASKEIAQQVRGMTLRVEFAR